MMTFASWIGGAAALAGAILLAAPASAGQGCATRRMTAVGPFCIDRFEASVWRIPPEATELIKAAQTGKPTEAELLAGGATQLGLGTTDDYAPCNDDGSGCTDVYAVGAPGVQPSANITWFQAQQACINARKRLPLNDEWQGAVTGTPDPGDDDGVVDCNTNSAFSTTATGSRSACVSRFGNFDMVGNLAEWVADWLPASTDCPGWGTFSDDSMCVAGASTTATGPGVLVRGGDYLSSVSAGPFSINGSGSPLGSDVNLGFRCAR